jgi:predicted tellurium resistance membrane protein TerC
LKWMERFPSIVYIGAGVLALTAASMIDKDPLFEDYLLSHRALDWALYIFIAGSVLLAGYWRNSAKRARASPADAGLVVEAVKR